MSSLMPRRRQCKPIAGSKLREFRRMDGVQAPGDAETSYYNFSRMVRFLTAGESHGRALVVILEGIPAGLSLDLDAITRELRRRQGGYGRGRRMAIESDRAQILSGVRAGQTHRQPDRDDDREPRLGELAVHDAVTEEPPPDAARRAARR